MRKATIGITQGACVMTDIVKRILQILMVVAGIFAYAYIFGDATWQYFHPDSKKEFSEQYVTFANMMAGLVGGIVAASFGLPIPPAGGTRATLKFRNLGRAVVGGDLDTAKIQDWLGLLYALVFVLIGFVALWIWIFQFKPAKPNESLTIPATVIKNVATVFLGTFIATIKAFFSRT
jgi:hypothetical protein